jgi:hypothetical protein
MGSSPLPATDGSASDPDGEFGSSSTGLRPRQEQTTLQDAAYACNADNRTGRCLVCADFVVNQKTAVTNPSVECLGDADFCLGSQQ